MNVLSVISIILGTLIALVVFIISLWYLLRYILQFFAAKHVDGSYIYDKKDFEKDGKTPITKKVSIQNNDFEFNFDNTTLHYNIEFGNKRALKYGVIRIRHQGAWYSSHPHGDEKVLIFQERVEENSGYVKFNKLEGDSNSISIEWMLQDTSIRIITHFSIYKNSNLPIDEPDLKYVPKELANLNFMVFSVEFPDGLEKTATNNFNKPSVHFPRFFNDSPNRRVLSFQNRKFSPASQQLISSSGPVTLFDESINTLVISPMDQFATHVTRIKGSDLRVSQFQCGLNGEIKEIPKKHKSHFIILFDKGINDSLYRLGDILRSYHETNRRSMSIDSFTSQLGYWTDNGARYYYNPIKKATLSETLILVKHYTEQMGIPICNYNLDSWWYKKDVKKGVRTLLGPVGRIIGGSLYGGTVEWDIDRIFMHVAF